MNEGTYRECLRSERLMSPHIANDKRIEFFKLGRRQNLRYWTRSEAYLMSCERVHCRLSGSEFRAYLS